MSSREAQQSGPAQDFVANIELPTLWVDAIRVSLQKSNITGQEVVVNIAFFHKIDVDDRAVNFENGRIALQPEMCRRFLGNLCKALDHYPTKEATTEQ